MTIISFTYHSARSIGFRERMGQVTVARIKSTVTVVYAPAAKSDCVSEACCLRLGHSLATLISQASHLTWHGLLTWLIPPQHCNIIQIHDIWHVNNYFFYYYYFRDLKRNFFCLNWCEKYNDKQQTTQFSFKRRLKPKLRTHSVRNQIWYWSLVEQFIWRTHSGFEFH